MNNLKNIWLNIDDVAVLTGELKETVRRKCKRGEYISTFIKDGRFKIYKIKLSSLPMQFQDKYYHSECFRNMATKKAASKRGKPQMWKDALESMWKLETETKSVLEHFFARDDLNEHLLESYNITMIPNRFWQIISDLENGIYKGKRCKPVETETLCGCWKWGQRKLNEINQYNRSHNKGPTDEKARLMYDLAILVGKVPQFLAYKEKQRAAEVERQRDMKENIKVDYSKIANNTKCIELYG